MCQQMQTGSLLVYISTQKTEYCQQSHLLFLIQDVTAIVLLQHTKILALGYELKSFPLFLFTSWSFTVASALFSPHKNTTGGGCHPQK